MKLLPALVAGVALFVGCTAVEPTPVVTPVVDETGVQPSPSPTPILASPTEIPTTVTEVPSVTRATIKATETAIPDADPESLTLAELELSSVEPASTNCSPRPVEPNVTPSPTPFALGEETGTDSTDVVQIDFPEWVNDCPQMAFQIASADIIVRTTFVTIDSEIVAEANESFGYSVDLIYTFVAEEYLKGDGPEEIVVRTNSGPAYNAFPDWFDYRSREDADSLAGYWLSRSSAIARNNADAILFLRGASIEGEYLFMGLESWRGERESPNIGTTWLGIDEGSGYRHTFAGGRPESITEEDLRFRIEDLLPLVEGEYGACAGAALYHRAQVREQVLGTLRQLTIGGYGDPWPFPMFEDTVSQGEALINVFKAERPPYPTPRFSHYWFDGEFRNRFGVNTNFEFGISLESFHATYVLPPGQYRVYYNQYHRSLPCNAPYSATGHWSSQDTAEWNITIAESTEE